MLFADDMVIMGDTPNDLQNSLDLWSAFCKSWALEVNQAKVKLLCLESEVL